MLNPELCLGGTVTQSFQKTIQDTVSDSLRRACLLNKLEKIVDQARMLLVLVQAALPVESGIGCYQNHRLNISPLIRIG